MLLVQLLYTCKYIFIGQVPLDPQLAVCLESGKNFADSYKGTPTNEAMKSIMKQLISLCDHKYNT